MFPVHIKVKKAEEPATDVFYIIARNGTFLRKKNDWIDAVVPVKQIAVLEKQEIYAYVSLPPLSATVFAQALAFFRAIYQQWCTESAVLLHYSTEKGWALTVPEQEVTSALVDYKMDERLEGYRCVGTMHSHASMSAFHSGTDQHDEAEWDGIHITIGSLYHAEKFTMEAEVVVNGARFILPENLIEGVEQLPKKEPIATAGIVGRYYFYPKDEQCYKLLPDATKEQAVSEAWLKMVKRKTYTAWKPPVKPGEVSDKDTNDVFWGDKLDSAPLFPEILTVSNKE